MTPPTSSPTLHPPWTPGADLRASNPGGLRAWVARHPVTSFLVLAFGLAYPVMALPILADHGVIADGWMSAFPGLDTERVASIFLVFFALLPATVVVTWAVDGRDGVRSLMARALRWRIGLGWWLLILTGLPVLTLAGAVAMGDTFRSVDVWPFMVAQVAGLLVNLVLINILEETGWAGHVQSRLQRRHTLVVAAALTAVPFALVHMPLHFIGDFTVGSLTTAVVTLLIVCTIVRILLGGVLRGTGSVLAVAVTHTMFNRSNNDEGIVAGLVDGDARKLAGLLAVIALGILVVAITRRGARVDGAATDGSPARADTHASTTRREAS
ncbi:CPBP family intramembrane glutamic endopeptidase [Nocardioides sp. GCM10028917]|uniref:CPBP family intramembrane glutamic endopeptidase n=1 Tax=Nocardioides sp. GCM10028917 TaxID=3273408 RepID=UPI00361AE1D7